MPLQLSQQLSQKYGLKNHGQRRVSANRTAAVARRVNGPKLLSRTRGAGIGLLPFNVPDDRTIVPQASFLESLTSKLRPQPPQPKKQAKTVFVAGSTGRVGARIVRELLAQGYTVRAGCRNVESAQEAIDVAEAYGLLTGDMIKRVEVVPFDITKVDSIREAIGGAQSVVCAVGAPENDVLNPLAPKAIDGDGTISLIKESAAAGVERFVLITSLGTEKVGWPASILNLFWGVLIWKREAEKALESSGMAYTILRPGGMERPTDSYKETHNLKLSPKNTTFGGQVSRLQVAELVGAVLNNPELSANKVLEVTAETTAPRISLEELLQGAAGIKADISPEKQKATREASKGAAAAVSSGDKRLAAAREELELAMDRIQAANASLAEAKDLEAEVRAQAAPALKSASGAEAVMSKAKAELEAALQAETTARLVLEEAKKVAASQANQPLSPQQLKAVREQVASKQRAAAGEKQKEAAAKPAAGIPFLSPPKPAETPAPKVVPAAAAPVAKQAPPAAPKVAPKAAPAPAPTPEPAAAAAPTPAPAPAPKKQAQPNFFAKLFGGGETIELDVGANSDSQKIKVPQKGEEGVQPSQEAPAAAPKAAPAAAAPKAAPAAAAPQQPAPQAPPQPAPAASAPPPPPAPKKPAVPVESAEEVERRMLDAIAEEKRQKAMADAKARLEREAKAIEAARLANLKASASPPPPPPAKKAAAPPAAPKAAPKAAAPAAAPKAAAPPAGASAPAGSAQANKIEAQRWIANWQQKQKSGEGAAPSSNGKPAAPPAAPASPAASSTSSQTLANKKEAQQWIANWQVKQGKAASTAPPAGNGASAPAPAGAAANKKDAQEWIARWQAKQKQKA